MNLKEINPKVIAGVVAVILFSVFLLFKCSGRSEEEPIASAEKQNQKREYNRKEVKVSYESEKIITETNSYEREFFTEKNLLSSKRKYERTEKEEYVEEGNYPIDTIPINLAIGQEYRQEDNQEEKPKNNPSVQPVKIIERVIIKEIEKAPQVAVNSNLVKEDTLLGNEPSEKPRQRRFFKYEKPIEVGNSIACAVHGEQTISNGSSIKLRLLEDLNRDNISLKKGEYVYGVCSINNYRMIVKVSSLTKGKDIYPVDFSLYDLDGIEGFRLPPNVRAQIARETKSQTIQQSNGVDEVTDIVESPIMGSVNVATKVASKAISSNIAQVKININSDYRVLIKEKNI